MFVSPFPGSEEIEKQYSGRDYFERSDDSTGYKNYLQDRELHLVFFRKQLSQVEAVIPKGRLLDIGCAGGFLVEEACKRGWQAQGVELSPFVSDYARDTLGLEVFTGTAREANFNSDTFSAVVMDDVIEHFTTPLTEIREVHRILKTGGVLVLHTPNAGSPWRYFMGPKWVHLKPNEHLFYFSPATIRKLLEKAGFEVISVAAVSKATNMNYICGVLGKSSPRLAQFLHGLFSKSRLWWSTFPFRGGGMQVIARKKQEAA